MRPGAVAWSRWWAAAALLLGLGLVLGAFWLAALAAVIAAVVLVSHGWSRWALARVTWRRQARPSRLFAGERTVLELELCNDKLLPLGWLQVLDDVPTGPDWGSRLLMPSMRDGYRQLVHAAALRPYDTVRWRIELPCPRRGHYRFGPARLRSGDHFGLSEVERVEPKRDRIIVYPALRELPRLGFPAEDPLGDGPARRALLRDPLRVRGVRDHTPGDPRRRVHWKASARGQGLKVRLEDPVREETVVVVLDTATERENRVWVRPDAQEAAIALAGSILRHAHDEGRAAGFVATAVQPGGGQVRVPAARGPAQLPRLLSALAAIGPYVHGRPARLVAHEAHHAPWGATLVVVTHAVHDDLVATLLRMHRLGRSVVLVSMDTAWEGAPPFSVRRIEPETLAFSAIGESAPRRATPPRPADQGAA